jgi:hypothetical protein
MQERPGQLVGALPLVKEDEKQVIDDPTNSQVSRVKRQRIVQVEPRKV